AGSSRTTAPGSNCHLLQDQTIYSDPNGWMNYDAVRVGDKKPAANHAIQWDLSSSYRAPKLMSHYKPFAKQDRHKSRPGPPILMAPDRQQELSTGIPKTPGFLANPVGRLRIILRAYCRDFAHSIAIRRG